MKSSMSELYIKADETVTLNEAAISEMIEKFKKIAAPKEYKYNSQDYADILACWHELSTTDKKVLKSRLLAPDAFPSNKVFRTCTRVMTLFLMENKTKSTLHNPVEGQPPAPLSPKHKAVLTDITKFLHKTQAIALKQGGYGRPHSLTPEQQRKRLHHLHSEVKIREIDPTANYNTGFRPITPTTSEAESNIAIERMAATQYDFAASPKTIFRPIPTSSISSEVSEEDKAEKSRHERSLDKMHRFFKAKREAKAGNALTSQLEPSTASIIIKNP